LTALARYDEALAAYEVAIDSATRAGNTAVRMGAIAYRAITLLLMGDVSRAEEDVAAIVPEIGSQIAADSVPAMALLQAQARIEAAHDRLPQAIAGLTRIVQFYDDRHMAVAPVVRTLLIRGDIYLRQGDADAALADAARALAVSRPLQGDKPYSSLTGLALLLTARVEESRGDTAAAKTLAGDAVPHLTATLGAEHPDTRLALGFSGTRPES
jgi:tetratricopeptide (TPR) repeat protein